MEIALGRSEMEVPAELWLSEEGLQELGLFGRVREKEC